MIEVIVVSIVIFILLLFIRVKLTFLKADETKITVTILFISFEIPQIKGKSIDIKKLISNVTPIYSGIKYLLNHSSVEITELSILSVFSLAEKPLISGAKFIGISTALAFIASNAKEYKYNSSRYIVTEYYTESGTKITFNISFLLYRLIISLFLVAYYKVEKAIKGRVKNV